MEKVASGGKPTPGQLKLLSGAGFGSRPRVAIENYQNIPLPEYDKLGVLLADIPLGECKKTEVIIQEVAHRWMVEDNSGMFEATFCREEDKEVIEKRPILKAKNGRLYILPADRDLRGVLDPERWLILHASPRLQSKKGNNYYKIVIAQGNDGAKMRVQELVLMDRDGIKGVRRGKYLVGEIENGFFNIEGAVG
jgi:hypothetical protein